MKLANVILVLAAVFCGVHSWGGSIMKSVGRSLARVDKAVFAPVYQGAGRALATLDAQITQPVIKNLDKELVNFDRDSIQPAVKTVSSELAKVDPIKAIDEQLVELNALAEQEILLPILMEILRSPEETVEVDLPVQSPDWSKDDIKQEVRRHLGLRSDVLNILLTGPPRTGKASLINGLRGLKNNAAFAARVGYANASTLSRYNYSSENWDFYKLAKQPDSGISANEYFEKYGFCSFDVIVIVFNPKIRDNIDAVLCQQAKNWSIPVIFVRNKIDIVLTKAEREYGMELDDAKPAVRNKTISELKPIMDSCGAQESDLYLVTADSYVLPSRALFKMDEDLLKARLKSVKKLSKR